MLAEPLADAQTAASALPAENAADRIAQQGAGANSTAEFKSDDYAQTAKQLAPAPSPSLASNAPVKLEREELRRKNQELAETSIKERETKAIEAPLQDNPLVSVQAQPVSALPVAAGTQSYSAVRAYLTTDQRPPKDKVRIEELVNRFGYRDPAPSGSDPIAVGMEVASCPWMPAHRLVRIGIKSREVSPDQRPPANLVFYVSKKTETPETLPALKTSLGRVVKKLGPRDTVAIVEDEMTSDNDKIQGVVLGPTNDKAKVLKALDNLETARLSNESPSTAGMELAYQLAKRGFVNGGANSTILATDADTKAKVDAGRPDVEDLSLKRSDLGGNGSKSTNRRKGRWPEHLCLVRRFEWRPGRG